MACLATCVTRPGKSVLPETPPQMESLADGDPLCAHNFFPVLNFLYPFCQCCFLSSLFFALAFGDPAAHCTAQDVRTSPSVVSRVIFSS